MILKEPKRWRAKRRKDRWNIVALSMRLVDRENFYCNKKEVSRKKIKERKKKDERKMGWLITRVETQQAGSQRSRINLNCIGHAERGRNEADCSIEAHRSRPENRRVTSFVITQPIGHARIIFRVAASGGSVRRRSSSLHYRRLPRL